MRGKPLFGMLIFRARTRFFYLFCEMTVRSTSTDQATRAPHGLTANAAPQDRCDPDSSEEELGLDTEYMEKYGRVEQRRQHLARDASHDDGRAAA